MKEENEITEEVRELLDSLEQHGQNARRQMELSDLIDSLEAGSDTSLRGASATKQSNLTQTETIQVGLLRSARNDSKRDSHSSDDAKRRKLYPIWWIVGAAAACLLLWLLAKPAMKETPNMNEEILVEEIYVKDTIITQGENDIIEETVIIEEPDIPKKLLAEETPVKTTQPQTKNQKPNKKPAEDYIEKQILSENTAIESTKTETIDTSNSEPNPIPTIDEKQLPTPHSSLPTPNSHRRVIQSLNLVCYECQKEPEYTPNPSLLTPNYEKTLLGQPQDPNMKNGSLAFELKLQ